MLSNKEAFTHWQNVHGMEIGFWNIAGYMPAPYGITILLKNGTGIPYPYLGLPAALQDLNA